MSSTYMALGFAVVVCSWWLHIKSIDYRPLMKNQIFTAPVVLIISAKFSMLLGAIGCIGAWFEKKILLFIYIITMIIIFVALLLGVVFVIAFNERVAMTARKELLENIRQYPGDEGVDENNFRKTMNSIQKRFHCCGVDQYQDWFNADIWIGQPYVPDSCCIEEINGCGKQIAANETYGLIYTNGCFNMIQMEINRNLMIVGILAFVLVFVEGFCIVAALGLLCYLRQRDRYI
ncbi:unnamed protein product [Rotaria sp. Silwood1]|nr:unnamed protein product [Rotaria sp. Silwood1]CAF3629276.1 unnamed protein product [Rotaria sp. Silwood1]CAF3716241.1 unnamed protein product [Rotaria sp. Silwood1]CAF4601265.1 unnamed protein product [Rotaria sp. Silwood1]CAF4636633.1 unnamed protein product [Rotaria sp. Silwood1]